jgi:hypothetical protein
MLRPISKAALKPRSVCSCSCNLATWQSPTQPSALFQYEFISYKEIHPKLCNRTFFWKRSKFDEFRRKWHKKYAIMTQKICNHLSSHILLKGQTSIMQSLLPPLQTGLKKCIAFHLLQWDFVMQDPQSLDTETEKSVKPSLIQLLCKITYEQTDWDSQKKKRNNNVHQCIPLWQSDCVDHFVSSPSVVWPTCRIAD